MQKFIVLYMAPSSMMAEWMKTDPETRKKEEEKMKADWDAWMASHKETVKGETAGVGKMKKITKGGVADGHNDIMLYTIIEAESHEAAADLFKDHPHFGIPEAWIEVMPINHLPGMEATK